MFCKVDERAATVRAERDRDPPPVALGPGPAGDFEVRLAVVPIEPNRGETARRRQVHAVGIVREMREPSLLGSRR